MATGLYDPAYEHDACGVGMVADLHGRPDHDIVDRGLTVLERLAHRGASGAEVETGDGAGILVQIPHRFLQRGGRGGRVLAARRRGLRRRPRLPAHRPRRRAEGPHRRRADGRRGGPVRARLAHRADRARGPGQDRAGRHAADRAGLRGAGGTGASTPWPWSAAPSSCASGPSTPSTASTSPRCRPARSSTRACSPPSSCASSSPTCATPASSPAWPWCTRASRPTRSRAGRWPTRTATWPTTARSTRWPATATGCGPGRRCSRRRSFEGDLSRIYPICTPGASDSASFDEVLELLHLGGRSLPHAVLMMIPEAWENHTTMDRDRRAFYRYHASLMEPWDGPAAVVPSPTAPSSAPCSTATACARRATGSPTTAWSSWPARWACSTSPPSASCARAACSRAACSSSTRPRAGSSRTRRSRPSWPPSTPTPSGWPPTRSASTSCRPGPCSRPSTAASSPSSGCSATPPRSCG